MSASSEARGLPSRPVFLAVDGESWEVTANDGRVVFNWLSGRADGYGFTAQFLPSDPAPTIEQLQTMIRDFMGNINPETGYLD